MKHRRFRKQPDAPRKEGTPFFATVGAQPGVQPKTESFFQPKLTIGQPGDRYEQEADRMADAVVNHAPASSEAAAVRKKPKLQRQEEEEEAAQPKLQRQEEEEEAAQPKLQRQPMEEEEEMMQPRLQRQEEEEEAAQPKLQPQQKQAGPALAQRLADSKGRGRPLPPTVRQPMEGAFETDFSGVRVHTDQEAVQMNEGLGAQAFTHGQDVYFNEGKFDPGTQAGKHLLAHELTHVVQQRKK